MRISCVTWRIYTCDMTHSYVWHISVCSLDNGSTDTFYVTVWHDSFIRDLPHTTWCVTWRIHMWHDSHYLVCDMTHSYVIWLTLPSVWHDSCVYDMTHSCIMPWLIHVCHNSLMCDIRMQYCVCKRAICIRKRALCIHKKAISIRKRVIYIRIPIYLQKGPVYFSLDFDHHVWMSQNESCLMLSRNGAYAWVSSHMNELYMHEPNFKRHVWMRHGPYESSYVRHGPYE